MNILFVAPRFHPNQQGWVKALKQAGHSVSYLVFTKEEYNEWYDTLTPLVAKTKPTPQMFQLAVRALMWLKGSPPRAQFSAWPTVSGLKEVFATVKPDLVIIRDAAFPLSIATYRMAKSQRIPALLYSQHPLEATLGLTTKIFQIIGLTPKVRITPSRSTNQTVNRKTRTYYVPLITNVNFDLNQKKYLQSSRLNLLSVAKLDLPRKRHFVLFEVVQLLARTIPVHLTVVGSLADKENPYYLSLVEYLKHNQLEQLVTLHYNLPFDQMPTIFQANDIFVLPSDNEPYSISPLEAMAYGLPAVVQKSNGMAGSITAGHNGNLIDNANPDRWAEVIKRYSDRTTLEKAGQAAHTYVGEELNEQSFIALLISAYKAVS